MEQCAQHRRLDAVEVDGTEGEAFVAEGYEPEFTKYTGEGQYLLLEGVGHLDVVNDPATQAAVKDFLADG